MGQFCFFLHAQDLINTTCKHFIQIRSTMNSHLFPKAKKYLWLHDEANEGLKEWNKDVDDNKLHVIGVSKWHKKDIEKYLLTSRIDYIYNPVPDEIYKPDDVELKYDPNAFIWAASPHKGLGKAIEVFKKLKERLPHANLLIAHPGYHDLDLTALQQIPGVAVYGPQPAATLWAALQSSLCVFYPVDYNETFCCIAAEANALGVPFLSYSRQVLKETVSSDDQLVEDGNEQAIVDKAVEWTKTGRPKVSGQEQFKLSRVIFKWLQLLGR